MVWAPPNQKSWLRLCLELCINSDVRGGFWLVRHNFFSHTFAKKLFKTINDKQTTVFTAIKRRPNFSIINFSFNLCCSLKAKSFLKFRKSIKVVCYLTLNVDMIEVFVLAKSPKPDFSLNITVLFFENMKAKMTIIMAQQLFS